MPNSIRHATRCCGRCGDGCCFGWIDRWDLSQYEWKCRRDGFRYSSGALTRFFKLYHKTKRVSLTTLNTQGALLGGGAGVLIRQNDRRSRQRFQDRRTSSVPANDVGGSMEDSHQAVAAGNQPTADGTMPGFQNATRRRRDGSVTYYSTHGGGRRVVTHTFTSGGGDSTQDFQSGAVTPLDVMLQSIAMGGASAGNDFEQLLSIFSPPQTRGADASSIRSLPTNQLTEDDVNRLPKDHQTCSICLYAFEAGDEARRLPCFHVFHSSCIDPWLGQNAKCPICMHEVDL